MIAYPRAAWSGKAIPRMDEERAEAEQAPEWVKEVFGPTGGPDYEDRESVKTIGVEAGMVGLECEMVQPGSVKGRTVYVIIPPEQVLAVLKLCRNAAAAQRSKGMGMVSGG